LREYWRWMKPKAYLFPGTVNGSRADKPISPKMVWAASREATQRAGVTKPVRPHLPRHTSIHLHLSEHHLRAAGTPLDNAKLSSPDQAQGATETRWQVTC
jgi:integrase/recombinase XerD